MSRPRPADRHVVSLTVNGVHRAATVESRRTLSDFLRHDLGLTGTHVGCEHGVCGACTVLLDGTPVRSCLLFAVTVDGQAVTTVEGLGRHRSRRHRRACRRCSRRSGTATRCSAASAPLASSPPSPPVCGRIRTPALADAVAMIAGNLCRCTGYQNIVAAVLRAAELAEDPDAPLPDEGFDHDARPGDRPDGGET